MRNTHFSGLAFILAVIPAPAEIVFTPDHPAINYYGRFDFSNPKSPRFNWSGATLEFAVSGTATVGMELTDGAGYYDVEVDGKAQTAPVFADGYAAKKYSLAAGLSPDPHVIRVIRRNEPYWVIASFGGISLADGGKLETRPKPVRKMEFIGDSWTAGYFNESCSDQQSKTNVNKAWARLTSKAFHAQDIILAESGIGLVKSLGGKTTMPGKYPNTFDTSGTTATPPWNFSAWKPDVVSIFLGINDKNAGATDAEFIAAIHAFVATLRGHYPEAAILFISRTGNMDVAAKAAVAAETTSLGRKRIYFHECKTVGVGCQAHPTLAENQEIAAAVVARVMQITGWDTTQAPVTIRAGRPFARSEGSFTGGGLQAWRLDGRASRENGLENGGTGWIRGAERGR